MAEHMFLATMRATFHAEDEVEARLVVNEIEEAVSSRLDEEDTLTVTQIIPADQSVNLLEPTELVNQMRAARDMLIKTRIVQCFELAKELDKTAWILENRREATFDLSSYDYTSFFEHSEKLLGRTQ